MALGIAYRIDDGHLAGHEKDGIYPAGSSVQKYSALPVPAVYVIDKSGKIVFNYVNADFTVRLKAEDLLSAAEQVAGN
jgi:peroxiredoxin